MFCEKCGSILVPKKEGAKRVLACSCGFKQEAAEHTIKEQGKQQKEMEIVDEEITNLPVTKEECPKCKHEKAYYWTVQTRAGDEPETKFMKCEKCKHTWRDYN